MWKIIQDFPNYSVSDTGEVRWNKRNRLLTPMLSTSGYYYVQFCDSEGKHRTKYVHGLVASAFLEKKPGQTQVDHINGNKLDNRVSNLRWVTVSENVYAYGYENRNKHKRRPILATHVDGTAILFPSRQSAAEYFDCDTTKIAYNKRYVKSSKKGWIFRKLARTSGIVPIDAVLGDEPIVVRPS